jgi:hypothetical protein
VTLHQIGYLAAALLVAWVLIKLRVYPAIGAGYRAKAVCTALFGSGRAFDANLKTQISDDSYRILRPFRVHVDREARTVTASLLWWFPRTAVHRRPGATLPPAAARRAALRRQTDQKAPIEWAEADGFIP